MSYKKINFFEYDAYMHLPCLRGLNEQQQFEIIDQAESEAGSFLKRFMLFHLSMTAIGLSVFGLIFYFTNSFTWPTIWLTIWSSYCLVFASSSRKLKHLKPHIEKIAKEHAKG